MKLVSYRLEAASQVGVVIGENRLASLSKRAPSLPRSLREILEAGDEALSRAREVERAGESDHILDETELLPVVPDPPATWCVGVNYEDHLKETGREPTKYPTLFLRIAASQVGHLQAMVRPKASVELDYEGELAVVIGRSGRHIPESEAFDYVAGYSCYNDGSVRDWQRHTTQFGPGKNFHRTGALGPGSCSIGGPAAILALESIRKVEVVEYEELGMETVFRIDVESFPAFIVVDGKGNDFFSQLS